jgi:hypothetical protein
MTLTNVGVEWLSHVLSILKVPGSNPDPDIGYPDSGFRDFSQYVQINTLHLATSVSLYMLSNSLFTYRRTILSY